MSTKPLKILKTSFKSPRSLLVMSYHGDSSYWKAHDVLRQRMVGLYHPDDRQRLESVIRRGIRSRSR